jgi:hypothetical protein
MFICIVTDNNLRSGTSADFRFSVDVGSVISTTMVLQFGAKDLSQMTQSKL